MDTLVSDSFLTQVPPHSKEAEMAVLGSCLLDSKACEYAAENLEAQDFYDPANQKIFKTIMEMRGKGSGIDLPLLVEALRVRDTLAEVGGVEYLAKDLIESVATAAHIEHYSKIVKDAALARFIVNENTKIIIAVQEKDYETGIETLHQLARAVEMKKAGQTQSVTPKEFAQQYLEELEARKTEREPEIMTGFKSMDATLWGLKRGELVTVGGRPGRGKSCFLLNVGASVLKKKKRVLYFTTEMNKTEQWSRLIPILTGIKATQFRQASFTEKEWAEVAKCVEWLHTEDRFIVCDTPSPTLGQIRSLVRKHRPDVVLLDYLTRFSLPKADKFYQSIGEFMRMIKDMARKENVVVILAAQLNRSLEHREEKTPNLADLKESGAIEEESDIVILLYNESQAVPLDFRVLIAKIEKNRGGEMGSIRLNFFTETLKLVEPLLQ